MSKVITFSRVFPVYHFKAGRPTNFIRKMLKARYLNGELSITDVSKIARQVGLSGMQTPQEVRDYFSKWPLNPKHHTIRGGQNWKAGDKFSPRAWSGKPYNSKQIHLGPDIEIVEVIDFKFTWGYFQLNGATYHGETEGDHELLEKIATNDGLETDEFKDWFTPSVPFVGQIICWTPKLYA